jgi:hypothetical protein
MEAITMRNLLALVGAAVVGFAGLGWYLGWYHIGTDSGKVEVEINAKKVISDVKAGEKKAADFVNKSGPPAPTPTPKTVEGQPVSNSGVPIPELPKLEPGS